MGLANDDGSFWKQMYEAKEIESQSFSLCFGGSAAADPEGTKSGTMTMGGTDDRLHKTPMVFAPLQGSWFYTVRLRKMYLRDGSGGLSVMPENANATYRLLNVDEESLNYGGIIVDSGTTDTFFSSVIRSEFTEAWTEFTGMQYTQNGLALTDDDLKAMPSVILQIVGDKTRNLALNSTASFPVAGLAGSIDPDNPDDMILIVPPTHYLEYDDAMNQYIPRIYMDESSGSVLGSNTIMGHDVYFDLDNNIIGVSESDCNYSSLLESHNNVTHDDRGNNTTGDDHMPSASPVNGNSQLPSASPEDDNNQLPSTSPVGGGDNEEDATGADGQPKGTGTVEAKPTSNSAVLFCQTRILASVVMVAVVAILIEVPP
jgi:hypothetical protein